MKCDEACFQISKTNQSRSHCKDPTQFFFFNNVEINFVARMRFGAPTLRQHIRKTVKLMKYFFAGKFSFLFCKLDFSTMIDAWLVQASILPICL